MATLGALVRIGAFADTAERGNFVDGATRFCFAQDVFTAAARASFRYMVSLLFMIVTKQLWCIVTWCMTRFNQLPPGFLVPWYVRIAHVRVVARQLSLSGVLPLCCGGGVLAVP